MGDCESNGADKGGPIMRPWEMKCPKNGLREEGEQDTDVESRGDVNLQKSERD